MPGNSSREEQTTSAVSHNIASLITLPRESNSWIPMNESHIPSPKHTSSLGFDLHVASRAQNHGHPELSTVRGFVINPVAGSPWPHIAPESRSVSLPERAQLPSKAIALDLVQETFNNYNRFLPLFDEEDFLRDFRPNSH